jgi:hypothetical protein
MRRLPYDRAAIMRDAHKRFRDGKRLGLEWSFGQCLSTAWAAARIRRETMALARAAPGRRRSLGGANCLDYLDGARDLVGGHDHGSDRRFGNLVGSHSNKADLVAFYFDAVEAVRLRVSYDRRAAR